MKTFEYWKKLRRVRMEWELPKEMGDDRSWSKVHREYLDMTIWQLGKEMEANLSHYPEYRAYRLSKGLSIK